MRGTPILLTLNEESAARLGPPHEPGDEVEAYLEYTVTQDGFDHEFGTHWYEPECELLKLVVNGHDLLNCYSDDEQLEIIRANELLPRR